MQQLFEAFGINAKLIIAQAINFGLLLIALKYFLYTPILKTLDARRQKIAQGVQDADTATQALSGAKEEAKELVALSHTHAEEIVSGARTEAIKEKARIAKEAEAHAQVIEKDAQSRAEELMHTVKRESEKEIARLAILAAEKVLRTAA
jgi:F-type H+-transporting ATPase subunit b